LARSDINPKDAIPFILIAPIEAGSTLSCGDKGFAHIDLLLLSVSDQDFDNRQKYN
jgi:hypothetical protein